MDNNIIDIDLGIVSADSSNNILRVLQDGYDNDINFYDGIFLEVINSTVVPHSLGFQRRCYQHSSEYIDVKNF